MKSIFIICLFATITLQVFGQKLDIISYNIRFPNPDDGENVWDKRKEKMLALLDYYEADFIGLQEAYYNQLSYLNDGLVNYTYVGVGKRNGKKQGAFNAILYDSTKFEVIKQATFWLSDTPNKISRGWDAKLERICTYGLFKHKVTKNKIWVFNTHFDHKGEKAKKMSAQLILDKIAEINTKNHPLVLMGDLNAHTDEEPIIILNKGLADALSISQKPLYGPKGTYNGFNPDSKMRSRIDFFFVAGLQVLSYAHLDDRLQNQNHISDHFPIMMRVKLKAD